VEISTTLTSGDRELFHVSECGFMRRFGGSRSVKSLRKWLVYKPAAFAAPLPPGWRILNAGSGDRLFVKSTHVCNLRGAPVPELTFDVIVFTQGDGARQRAGARSERISSYRKERSRPFYSAPL
jgi:hypothetical protein